MSASAVADVDRGEIHARIEIAAPPEAVFRALTDPRELAAWWGSDDMYRTFDWTMDLRPGGRWSAHARNAKDEDISIVRGEVRAIDPPRMLEYTWEPSWDGYQQTTVRFELEPTPVGTRLTLVHFGFGAAAASSDAHAEGWKHVLAWLDAGLAARKVAS
jgi:uncharacterized protein YndB with AHSA1/START domain